MDLRCDEIRHAIYESDDSDSSLFGDDDTDNDPDYVSDQSDYDELESGDEDAQLDPNLQHSVVPDQEASTSTAAGDLVLNIPLQRTSTVNARVGKNGHLWSMSEPERRGRPFARNLISHLPGARGAAKQVTSPIEAWKLLINDEILNEILLRTNLEIEVKLQSLDPRQSYHKCTTKEELLAFFGLLYLAGVQKNNKRNLDELWSVSFGTSLYRATMSLHRFKFLSKCLRYDDRQTRIIHRQTDKFAPIRNVWEIFISNCKSLYTPFEHCTIDEQMLGYRGKCPFRVFIKSKPDKYDIKIIMLNDAKTFYMLNAIPYTGTFKPPNHEPIASHYVKVLSEPIHGTYRNITVDNWFSSIPLFSQMLQNNKLTMVGTLRVNKPEIPPSFLAKKGENLSLFAFDNNKMLVSYSPKKTKMCCCYQRCIIRKKLMKTRKSLQ